MSCVSTIDHQARLDVRELLSRYCQYIDHNQGAAFAELFTHDAVFELSDGTRLTSMDEFRLIPGMVWEMGGGQWRHQITNVVIDRGVTYREVTVTATGLVLDWNRGGAMASCYDYRIEVCRSHAWRIRKFYGGEVGSNVDTGPCHAWMNPPPKALADVRMI